MNKYVYAFVGLIVCAFGFFLMLSQVNVSESAVNEEMPRSFHADRIHLYWQENSYDHEQLVRVVKSGSQPFQLSLADYDQEFITARLQDFEKEAVVAVRLNRDHWERSSTHALRLVSNAAGVSPEELLLTIHVQADRSQDDEREKSSFVSPDTLIWRRGSKEPQLIYLESKDIGLHSARVLSGEFSIASNFDEESNRCIIEVRPVDSVDKMRVDLLRIEFAADDQTQKYTNVQLIRSP